jgi:hypothetical protein
MIDRLRSISPPVAAVLVAVALALVFVVGWFTLVAPKRSEAAQLQREIDTTRVLLERPAPPRAKADSSAAEAASERLLRAMPDRVEMPAVVLDLHRLAAEAGVRLDAITPSGAVAQPMYQSMPVAITLQGSFFAFSDFLRRLRGEARVEGTELQGDGRIYSVESITFAEGLQKFPSLTASLSVSTVFGPAAAPAAGAVPGVPGETPTDAAAQTP